MSISIEALVKRLETIKDNRHNWENHWQDLANYCLPQKAIITETRSPGTRLRPNNYDSTAIQSAQIFAAGLQTYLTNPATLWFSLGLKNKELMKNKEVKDWLKLSEDTIFDYFNDSNFNEAMGEDYINFAIFGNSTLYEEEDPIDAITFASRPVKEIYFLANHRGRIDTVYREFTYTARQAFQRWGDNAGQKVKDLMEAGKVEEKVVFLHIVLPREDRDVRKKDARNMPFGSIYIEPKTKKILSEGGYMEFPYFIGRSYKVSDSEYAYSPASMGLADIRMVNEMSKDILEAAQKTLHPPTILPHDGYLLPFKTTAKAINYKLSGSPDDKVETLQLNREIGLSLEMENQRRDVIKKAFFVDLFLMLANLPDKIRTATEIIERINEIMLILGPMLGRLMHEKLDPLITRTFNILVRKGIISPPPEILARENFKINYISPLAKAQKASEARSLSGLVVAVQSMAEITPSVVDKIDSDKIIDRFAEINFVSDVLRSDDEVKQIRAARAEQEQITQAIEMANAGGKGAQEVLKAEEMAKGGVSEK